MPKQAQSIPVNGMDKEAILSVCLSSFEQLNWTVLYAGEDKLLSATPESWNKKGQHIIAMAVPGELTISSEMTGNELMDIRGKNKKNIESFLKVFESVRNSMQPAENEKNKIALIALRAETERAAVEEEKNAVEIDKAMNLTGSNLYATYLIIALNIIVFILMATDGAGIIDANGLVHIKWGSNFAPLTLSGDWWRLVTCVFIHFGIIHLGMNMYTLYSAGVYLEPLLGKKRYMTAYLCTGILASITSLWWHKTPVNSAGASGAVFGMYGLFLAFLTTNLIPEQVRKALLQSIGIFIVYNLLYGMKGGVDNSAHVGGLISGFIIGYIYVTGIKKEKQDHHETGWSVPLIVLITAGITFYYLQQHKSPAEARNTILNEIKGAEYKDNNKFNNAYNRFVELQDKAMAPLHDTIITDVVRIKQLKEISLPEWDKAETLAKEMQSYELSDQMHKKAAAVLQYIQLRKEEIAAIEEIVTNKKDSNRLNEIRNSIYKVVEELR